MNNSSNYHVTYPDVYRHWSPECEEFAGGDALLTKMRMGWMPEDTIYAEEYWLSGARLVVVYYFELKRAADTQLIPVLSNPFVRRFIRQESLVVRPIEELHLRRSRQHDADVIG